jgi:DNA-binding CsgD family transcriptional regulator
MRQQTITEARVASWILGFYILFFATGFMGAAALLLLGLRLRTRLIQPLLAFQLLFLVGLGIIVVYFFLAGRPAGINPAIRTTLSIVVTGINASIYALVIVLVRLISPLASRRKGYPSAAEILAGLVMAKSIAGMALVAAAACGFEGTRAILDTEAWNLGGYILSGLAMAAFGVVARGPLAPDEPAALKPLLKAYGLCAIVFAPLGLLEYAVEKAGIPGLPYLSTDHFFYLAWNTVSMSAAIRIFKPDVSGTPVLESVPEERIRALGLSARETEMAVMIARGLANKEIAGELGISPATVRTHIYNLYQKAGARSRVELINKLRA